ncbi:MAG: GNAT family N-acetyltransferase [Thermotaleaceae bacterium]
MEIKFKKVYLDSELEVCANIIRESFLTVAIESNLTRETAPSNPAFIELEDLIRMRDKGIEMFAVFEDQVQIGFVGVEKASEDGTYYMEKLSVLPFFRHRGYGKVMIDFIFEHVKNCGGEKIGIGIINENTVLKNWYSMYGFIETGLKKFAHLPFIVYFMEKQV